MAKNFAEDKEPPIYLVSFQDEQPSALWLTDKDRKMYHIQKGDTLQRIAGQMYGDPTMWNLIFQRNQSYIEDPDQIFAGQIIVIPKDIRDPMERVTVMSP